VGCRPVGPGAVHLFAVTLPHYLPVLVPDPGFRHRKQEADFDCVAAVAAVEDEKIHCLVFLHQCWEHRGWDRSVVLAGRQTALP
jgi:hypothetical protein